MRGGPRSRLPVDHGAELPGRSARPARPGHRTWTGAALVMVGGAIGTGLRFGLTAAIPPVAGIPVTTFAINLTGAFLLGWLLEILTSAGGKGAWRGRLRIALGTGVLGGFTTYSALATDTATLLFREQPMQGAGYAMATVVIGAVASSAGIWLGRRRLSSAGAR